MSSGDAGGCWGWEGWGIDYHWCGVFKTIGLRDASFPGVLLRSFMARSIEPVGRVEDKIAQVHRPCADMHHKFSAKNDPGPDSLRARPLVVR